MSSDLDRARSALRAIPCPADREAWWPILGSALAEGVPEDDVLRWCEAGPNFNRSEALASIRSLARRPANGRGGSLFAMARAAGWRDDSQPINGHRLNGHARPQQKRQDGRAEAGKGRRPTVDFRAVWEAAEPATADHGYIERKLGLPFGCRVYRGPLKVAKQALDGALLVPVLDADGELQSWQAIPPEGKKVNATGSRIAGGSFIVGGPVRDGEVIYLCEGVGTAWSAHQASGKPAVCCFGVGNVESVARELRRRHPTVRIVIVCDAGKEAHGERIARAVGGAWVEMPEGTAENDDLNDFHCQVGSLETVAELLATARTPKGPELPKLTKASELLTKEFSPIRWLIPGLLPEGLIVLAARPKVGKSWLALDTAIATATGGQVLGRRVERGDVLYLALEDSDRRMHSRLVKLRAAGDGLGDFEYATEWPRGAEGAAAIHQWIEAHAKARLVVIDVFTKMRASADGRETAYASDYTDVSMLKPPADRGVSILLVHHTRKAMSDDPIDDISGTLGIGGAADGAWVIKRARGSDEAELHLIGRDLEEEGAFAVRFDRESCRWQWMGEAWKVRASGERRQVLEALAGQPMKPAELARELGKKAATVRKMLSDMVKDGQVHAGLDGRYRPAAPGETG